MEYIYGTIDSYLLEGLEEKEEDSTQPETLNKSSVFPVSTGAKL